MVDLAHLGLAVDSSQVEKGTVSLHQLTGAAGQASAAARQLAGASQAEAAGQRAATVAARAHTAALAAQQAAMRSNMAMRTNMIFQLNDVGVSLASGMNPALVAMQQGSQMLQYGFAPAIRTIVDLAKSLVTRFWPVAAVIGAVSAAIGGLTYEINKTAATQVSFFDVALAGWQLLAERIGAAVAPAVNWVMGLFRDLWDSVAPTLKSLGNGIVGTFVGAFDAVRATWQQLPAALGDVVTIAAQNVVNSIVQMVKEGISVINGFLTDVNGIARKAGLGNIVGLLNMDAIDYVKLNNPNAGAAAGVASTAGDAFGNAVSHDYMGQAFDALSGRAQEIARARQELEGLGGAAKAANDNAKGLGKSLSDAARLAQQQWSFLRGTFADIFTDFKSGLRDGQNWWEALGNAGVNALDKISDRALTMAANGIFDMIFGSLFGGGFGSLGNGIGGGATFGGVLSFLASAKGNAFSNAPGLSAYSSTVVTRPTVFPFARGAGLMGEAGPEAIMPLKRTASGALGVQVANQNQGNDVRGYGDINITNHISVPPGTSPETAPAIAREVTKELKRQLPDAIKDYNRNPYRRAG